MKKALPGSTLLLPFVLALAVASGPLLAEDVWDGVHWGKTSKVEKCLSSKECQANAVRDHDGNSMLTVATRAGEKGMVKLLQKAGARADFVNRDGWTALHWASSYGNLDNLAAMLETDVDLGVRNESGKTPLDVARNPETGALLKAEPARRAERIAAAERAEKSARPGAWKAYQRGLSLMGEKRYPEALKEFNEAVKASPDYADYHYRRLLAVQGQGSLDLAADARTAAEKGPGWHPEYHAAYARDLENLSGIMKGWEDKIPWGDLLVKAALEGLAASEGDPENAAYRALRERTLAAMLAQVDDQVALRRRKGDWKVVDRFYTAVLGTVPDAPTQAALYRARGTNRYRMGRDEDHGAGWADLDMAVRLDPSIPNLSARADLYADGRREHAFDMYDDLVRRDPAHADQYRQKKAALRASIDAREAAIAAKTAAYEARVAAERSAEAARAAEAAKRNPPQGQNAASPKPTKITRSCSYCGGTGVGRGNDRTMYNGKVGSCSFCKGTGQVE